MIHWKTGHRVLPALGLTVVLLAWAMPAAAQQRLTQTTTDEQFIESLDDAASVDTKRLARMFFGLAAALEGGKSSVRLLQGKIIVPESSRTAVQGLLQRRYATYENSLGRFRRSTASLLDDPDSSLLFHRALTDGQRGCWYLDLHNRLIEAYGGADMLTVLSSQEACSKFRKAAFRPGVDALIQQALESSVRQQQRIKILEEELRDLEELVEDLRQIDAGD